MAAVSTPLPNASLLADFAPMAERAISIDAESVLRLRGGADRVGGFVRLPYEVLAGRAIAAAAGDRFDVTLSASDFLRWVDGQIEQPVRRDAHWLSSLPPISGWQRLDEVPEATISELISAGAELARDADSRSAQESLLASIVLTAIAEPSTAAPPQRADVALGPLSALTRLGFMPRGSVIAIDVCPGWTRVTAELGSAYAPTANPLALLGGRLN
ncbi:MAG: hypothetical protein JWO63_168 [Frankiales bacterium]|nr:hypothetical protein [Frankiales bacterium]